IAINRIYIDSADNVYVSTTIPSCFVINKKGEIKHLYQSYWYWSHEVFEINDNNYFAYIDKSPITIFSDPNTVVNSFNDYTFITIRSRNRTYKIKIPGEIHGRKNGAIRLSNGNLIFYAGQLLPKIFPDGRYSLKKFQNDILDVKESNDGKLFVATIQNGLYILNNRYGTVANYFSGLTVTGIEEDYEGGLWVSTTQSGAFYLNSLQMKHFSDKRAIINEKILCLEVANDSAVWAGGESGNILYFNRGKDFEHFSFPIISVNGIYIGDRLNTMFVCAGTFVNKEGAKLFDYKRRGIKFTFVLGISDILHLKEGVFGGCPNGILKIDFIKKTATLQNKGNFRVAELFVDDKGRIIVGNLFGLWRYIDRELQPYDSTKPILSSRITDINEYKGRYLLLGTRGKGFLVSINDSIYQVTTTDGLASDNIRKIYVDENIIWLATNKGISRLDIQSMNPFKYAIKNISVQDGLLSNEVNDIKRLDSNILVATNGGITKFSRNLFSVNKQTPLSLYVTGVKINGLDTAVYEKYDLHNSSRNFSISFVALSYRESSNIEYRYRLSGIDSNWIYSANREIQFNPIPYGRYEVQVQARRQGENWDYANSISLTINCRLPFWKTNWFLILCFLLVAFLMFLFFINRTRRIREREREKTLLNKKLAEMELKALRAQMNPHFIFNILNSIQYYIIHNENEAAQRYMSKFAKLVRSTLDNSRSTFISLADELALLRLYIDLEKIRFEDRFDYHINLQENINADNIKIPNMLLQPYVENSIKHGFKNKQKQYFLAIAISKKEGNIVCVIEDNGIGREKSRTIPDSELNKHSSTGTAIVQEKIEALKFYYNYDLFSWTEDMKDAEGNAMGTRVILTFPGQTDITGII
ncbi:MAG TPA: histidine kinase, partial [Chitinophagaceae bacterium]|nr:histidine kinase [Chitinophagaceae bacterium]